MKLAGPHQKPEKRRLMHSLFVPVTLVVLMFLVHLLSWLEDWDLVFLGVKPLSLEGLPGILLSPFIHGSWEHLGNNISSLFVLGVALRSEEHTSELQSRPHLVCRLLLEKKKKNMIIVI